MARNEERLQILKMVEEGKINSDEAKELLDAIDDQETKSETSLKGVKAKWLKVRVIAEDGKVKTNVNLPISLVDVGLKIATKFSPDLKDSDLKDIDLDEIITLIKEGAEGKIVEVESQEDNTRVEVYVE